MWVDTGHGGNRHRGLMRGEPEEKQGKDRQREGSRERGRGEKEGVSDRWCNGKGGIVKEREERTLENRSSKQKAKNRLQV